MEHDVIMMPHHHRAHFDMNNIHTTHFYNTNINENDNYTDLESQMDLDRMQNSTIGRLRGLVSRAEIQRSASAREMTTTSRRRNNSTVNTTATTNNNNYNNTSRSNFNNNSNTHRNRSENSLNSYTSRFFTRDYSDDDDAVGAGDGDSGGESGGYSSGEEAVISRIERSKTEPRQISLANFVSEKLLCRLFSNSMASTPPPPSSDPNDLSLDDIFHSSAAAKYRKGTVLELVKPAHIQQNTHASSIIKQGFLAHRGSCDVGFQKKYHVICDSVLLTYDSEECAKNNPERPTAVVSLVDSKIAPYKKLANAVMLMCGSTFSVLATSSGNEMNEWSNALATGRLVTHAHLMHLAFFNSMSLAAVNDMDIRSEFEATISHCKYMALGRSEYAINIPSTGGIEGFLECTFGGNNLLPNQLLFVLVRDSHMWVYRPDTHQHLGIVPTAIVHLRHCVVRNEGSRVLRVNTPLFGELVFQVPGLPDASRWKEMIEVASAVSLEQVYHAAFHREMLIDTTNITPPGLDLLDEALEPGCVQSYDWRQRPLFQTFTGEIVNCGMKPISSIAPRFSKIGHQLDAFNRPLPPGAVRMFAIDPVEPIGVGVDGMHYAYPSGREYSPFDPHYDQDGNLLDIDVVMAADAIIPHLQSEWVNRLTRWRPGRIQMFDAMGRPVSVKRTGIFGTREGNLRENASIFAISGTRIPNPWAFVSGWGESRPFSIFYHTVQNGKLVQSIKLGVLVIEIGITTLLHAHSAIKKHISDCFDAPVGYMNFLSNGTCIPNSERQLLYCSDYLPGIFADCYGLNMSRLTPNGKTFQSIIDHRESDEALSKARDTQIATAIRTFQASANQS